MDDEQTLLRYDLERTSKKRATVDFGYRESNSDFSGVATEASERFQSVPDHSDSYQEPNV